MSYQSLYVVVVGKVKEWCCMDQGFSKSETVGLLSDKAWKKAPPTVYLLSFAQFLDAYGIMIILFNPTDTQQLSQDSLIVLTDC